MGQRARYEMFSWDLSFIFFKTEEKLFGGKDVASLYLIITFF